MEFWILIVVFVAIDVVFVSMVLLRRRNRFSKSDIAEFKKRWTEIWTLGKRDSILEADKLFHYYAGKKGFAGTVGEILKRNVNAFSDIDGLWYAHKLRNRIAHEMDFKISEEEVRNAKKRYLEAFKDMGL